MHSTNDQNEFNRIRKQVDEQFQPPASKAMQDLRDFADVAVRSWELESEQATQMWAKSADLRIDDATKELIQDYLDQAKHGLNPDGHYSKGQDWESDTDVEWIWDQWIAKGFFHTITAMQKVGKSTFFLDFIKAICDGKEEYLNFSLFSEKKDLEFVLIGPDMGRRLWGTYGVKSELLQINDATGKLRWHEQIAHVFTEEDEYGLAKSHIARYVEIANEINAMGKHPVFVMDSYSSMLSAAGIRASENDSQFANPLRELKLALGRTGATSLMLHHSSLNSSKRSTETSNSGHQAFNRVPDQLLTLKWLAEAGIDGTRTDRRVVLSASGRTGSSVSSQLLEQSLDWGWSNHGKIDDALKIQVALEERDRIYGDDSDCFDILSTRTVNGQGTTTADLSELRDTKTKGRGCWSDAKIRRLLCKLERKKLAFVDGTVARDSGGMPWNVWWTFEKMVDETVGINSHKSHSESINRINTAFTSSPNVQNHPQTSQTSQTFHKSHTSFYGDNAPSVRQMVEDENGLNSMVVVELVPETGEVKVQAFGHASAPIKTRRWLVDVFPCGTFAGKRGHWPLDPDEEI
tara:strand:+ start:31 stop:1758 length:1728 start_codon:yes stop_codon:yes gene_type:complete